MSSNTVLVLLDFSQQFELEIDSSYHNVRAILMQRDILVTYFSQQLSPHNQMKPIYEKKLLVIILVVKKWHNYLMCS